MVGWSLAPKWPILVHFCGMDHQKSNFFTDFSTFSVRGCWGQPMLLFWKLIHETQNLLPLKATRHHNSTKLLIFLPLRANSLCNLHYETPCNSVQDRFGGYFLVSESNVRIWDAAIAKRHNLNQKSKFHSQTWKFLQIAKFWSPFFLSYLYNKVEWIPKEHCTGFNQGGHYWIPLLYT